MPLFCQAGDGDETRAALSAEFRPCLCVTLPGPWNGLGVSNQTANSERICFTSVYVPTVWSIYASVLQTKKSRVYSWCFGFDCVYTYTWL